MSQQQPGRPTETDSQPKQEQGREPVRYGDVFGVGGHIGGQAVTPKDAAMMQQAENAMLGRTQKGGAAAIMQSAATQNERAGLVGRDDTAAGDRGVGVAETDLPGRRIVTEAVGGQVVGQYTQPAPLAPPSSHDQQSGNITIGEALEATAITAGSKAVDQGDAAAIQAAEVRATGNTVITPGSLAAAAQSAATLNARASRDEDKTKLSDVLTNAAEKLPTDKAATRRDAEGVIGAEVRNNPDLATHPGGVAASVAAAARLNQNK